MAPCHATLRGIRPAFAAGALAWAAAAGAVTLGDIEVRTAPGQPFEARIAVTLAPGEELGASCFRIARGPREDGPFLAGGRLAFARGQGTAFLVVRTTVPVTDAATVLRVVVACPGPEVRAWRDYRRLFDPRVAVPSRVAPPAASAPPAPVGGSVPGLEAREDDTLESLAKAIFPRQAKARRVYLDALREQNPGLAALGARDPIPPGTMVVLPDLRTFARGRDLREAAVPPAAPPATTPRRAQPPAVAAPPPFRAAPAPPPARERTVPPAEPAPRKAAPRAPGAAPEGAPSAGAFVLRLSAPEIDLSRSRGIDDRTRAQLRERLLVLDADDQVAALLSLKHSLRQLEGRVAELQLKLAGMPAALQRAVPAASAPTPSAPKVPEAAPPPVAKAPASPAPPPMAAAPATVAAEAKPPRIEPPELPKPEAKPESRPQTEPKAAPKPEPEPKAAPKAAVETAPAPKPASPRPAARPAEPAGEGLPTWLWVVVALLALAAAAIAWRLVRRRAESMPAEPDSSVLPHGEPAADVADELEIAAELPEPRAAAPAPAPTAPTRRAIASDADLATSVPTGDPGELRRRYLAQRFPEIASGAIALDQPDSVVKGARLLYEDGALPRSVELLQFAIEENPAEVKPWLALFEIFRLQGLAGEFATLAERFRERHGQGGYWHKVQYFGRELDPANPLYHEPAIDQLETIGLAASRKLPPAPVFDPLAENWLDAPMDFNDEVLANELRKSVMAEAGLSERDLIPNPMPALRNVEMFTVA